MLLHLLPGKLLTVKCLREDKYRRRYPEFAYPRQPLRADTPPLCLKLRAQPAKFIRVPKE